MLTYQVTLTGKTPLLHHADDVEWSDRMDAWKNDPEHKAKSKPGDDRTPPFRWVGHAYHDGDQFVVPSDNIMKCLMEGGAGTLTGQGKKTFKAQTQSGCIPGEMYWPLLVHGKTVPTAPFFDEMEKKSFDSFQALAAKHQFLLFVKRVKVGQAKHIRVRPRFDDWSITGTITVTDEEITEKILTGILQRSGRYKGLGDWRPSSKAPGTFGMFTAEVRPA